MIDPGALAASYGELAFAILVWDKRNASGTRQQIIEAERKLKEMAVALRAVGYKVGT